jgi:hypothetical protein
MRYRRLAASVFAATLLLGIGTVGLAAVPPRPLRSALTVVYTLSFRVATDWLVVVALLAAAERYVSAAATVDRRTVRRLTALVLLGGLTVTAAPLARLVVESGGVGLDRLVTGGVAALRDALFPAGLFVATVVGAASLRDAPTAGSQAADAGRLPLSSASDPTRALTPTAVWRAARVLVVVAGAVFAVDVAARLALGVPYLWLAVVDAAVVSLATLVDYAVLAAAFLVLVTVGADTRSLVRGVVGVWTAVFLLSMAVAVLGVLAAVGLVGVTVTPMPAVEASTLGEWPTPDSWAVLLRLSTFVAGGVGLLTVQRATRGARGVGTETETGTSASDPRTD